MNAITEALQRLDALDAHVSDWEADFLESLLRRVKARPALDHRLSLKQKTVLAKMVDTYLEDGLLSAEILEQQRLFLDAEEEASFLLGNPTEYGDRT